MLAGRPRSRFVTCRAVERQRQTTWTELRAVIRRPAGEYLLVQPTSTGAAWDFPGARYAGPASAETHLRRHCQERLGLELNTVVAQPSFEYAYGSHAVRYLVFACSVGDDEDALPIGYPAIRWVAPEQLGEYAFEPAAAQIMNRLRNS